MANYIPYTVRTSISFIGRAIAAASFGNALFVSHHNIFSERQKQYTSVDGMLEDAWAAGSPAVKWATAVFAGKKSPDFVVIGRATPNAYKVQINEGALEDDTLSINMKLDNVATSFAYTVLAADVGDSQALGDGLATLIAADAGITSAISDANGEITIVPASLVTPISFGAALNTTVYVTTTETPSDIMTAILNEYSEISTLSTETHIATDIDLYAAYVESHDFLYVYSTSDIDTYDGADDTDVFSVLKGKQYQYTVGLFSESADVSFPEGALLGTFLSQSPAVIFTANLQDLVGISPSNLTSSQKSAIITKNGSFYEMEYGVGALKGSFTSNGDFLDRSRFGLWLKLRSQESMFATLKRAADRSSAVAYSDGGISEVRTNLYSDVIQVGIAGNTILVGTGEDSEGGTINYAPIIETSSRASQTNNNIGNRLWTGFEIEVVYNSAIHHIDSNGFILANRTAS